MKRLGFLVILLIATGSAVNAGITGSKHDFSAESWSGQEICIPCHTPHNAIANEPLLWNHKISVTTYTPYTSSTMTGEMFPLAEQSKLCLSCHDGITAIDGFGGNTGSTFITGSALIGNNLDNDHPIGVKWEHQTLIDGTIIGCNSCHENFSNNPTKMKAPFFGQAGQYTVECVSCHDPHSEAGFTPMLRMTNDGSALCLQCHER